MSVKITSRVWPFALNFWSKHRWRGGKYKVKTGCTNDEVEIYAWIFENKLTKDIKIYEDPFRSHEFIFSFRNGETFIAFKLRWLDAESNP